MDKYQPCTITTISLAYGKWETPSHEDQKWIHPANTSPLTPSSPFLSLSLNASTKPRWPKSETADNIFPPNEMAPSAMDLDTQPSALEGTIPPPKLYTPKEAYFQGYIEPESDGYRKAQSLGGAQAAIVIDNGTSPSLPLHPDSSLLTRCL